MKILYLSFYYKPDLCAGSFRNTPLIHQLAHKLEGKGTVDLQTTMPNRYASFSEKAEVFEVNGNLSVTRVELPSHKSGFLDQVLAFKKFYFSVRKNTKGKKYDLVVASSSRLFTAYLGYKIAKYQKIPLYLDIRDIFVDTLNDIIPGGIKKKILLPCIKYIERKTFSYAKHINLISGGFKAYFDSYKQATYSFFPNGIDKEFTSITTDISEIREAPFLITYAGNIGEGQGLHKIIPQAAELLGEDYKFIVIGDGGLKKELLNESEDRKLRNIEFIGPMSRDKLLEYYSNTDYLFMHLNDYSAFRKVLPSKVFEYGATDKPVIAGVAGYASNFVKENIPNHILFKPGDVNSFVDQIKKKHPKFTKRTSFIDNYGREAINEKIVTSILQQL